MRDMAQLRLKSEVNKMEGTLSSTDQPALPPYLVPDATVLCENLLQLKQLTNCARFIIIIPQIVIDHLDFLKKKSSKSREAIRWLEGEFQKGHGYVRPQKMHEQNTKKIDNQLKKKDRDVWRFMHIIDVAKYFMKQSHEFSPKGMVCVLTNLVKDKNVSHELT